MHVYGTKGLCCMLILTRNSYECIWSRCAWLYRSTLITVKMTMKVWNICLICVSLKVIHFGKNWFWHPKLACFVWLNKQFSVLPDTKTSIKLTQWQNHVRKKNHARLLHVEFIIFKTIKVYETLSNKSKIRQLSQIIFYGILPGR